jgi:hypothetical protein
VEFSSPNILARRFLDPPRFTWACVGDAAFYRARIVLRGGRVLWEGVLEEAALDFASFWERVPVGEVAWAITAWGSEGQPFDATGARRFHRAAQWTEATLPVDPESWEHAARRWARFLLSYRGPELGLFHRDPPPPGCVAMPDEPDEPPYRHHAAIVAGRFLRVGADPHQDHAPLLAALLTLTDHLDGPEAPALRERAAAIGEWWTSPPWPPSPERRGGNRTKAAFSPSPFRGGGQGERSSPSPTIDDWRGRREDGSEDLSSARALADVRELLDEGKTEEAVRLHRRAEDLFVTYGEDGSLAEEPHVPAVREWAGEPWVREGATARWIETLAALFAATGDPGYAARADAACEALARWQRPDGAFASFGVDRRLAQPGRDESRFADNARAAAALVSWRALRREESLP